MVPDNISPTNQSVIVGPQGPNFPVQWNPRYAIAAGFGANPDHRESYDLNTDGPRLPTVLSSSDGFVVNPKDHPDGFTVGERFSLDYSSVEEFNVLLYRGYSGGRGAARCALVNGRVCVCKWARV